MKHDDPNGVLIEPGKTADLTWKFTRDAELEIACNLPGHYEAGMLGHILDHRETNAEPTESM